MADSATITVESSTERVASEMEAHTNTMSDCASEWEFHGLRFGWCGTRNGRFGCPVPPFPHLRAQRPRHNNTRCCFHNFSTTKWADLFPRLFHN